MRGTIRKQDAFPKAVRSTRSTRSFRPNKAIATAAAMASLAATARGDLALSDTLLAYQLYGKDWMRIEGDAVTSAGGGIGSDRHVDITNNNVRINGDLTSGDRITAMANVDVAGDLNARGDVSFFNDNSSVAGTVNVGGRLSLIGSNPSGNLFASRMRLGSSPIQVAAGWAANRYNGADRTGSVNPGNAPAGVVFGDNRPFPGADVRFPDTTVAFDASRDCATVPNVLFNMSMCGLGGSSADTVLPPGRYGRFDIAAGNRIHLASGTYHFRSLMVRSDRVRFLFLQPAGAVTRVLIRESFTIQSGDQLLAPTRHADPSFTQGTVLIYVEGAAHLSDDNRFWATLVGKGNVHVETGLRLFGQVLGQRLTVENGFNGGPGLGRFIPLASRGPLRYSIIHYRHDE